MRQINVTDLKEQMVDDMLILDVRTPNEFESGHIPRAVNQPLNTLDSCKVEALANGRKIIIVCKSGGRSAQACANLAKSGLVELTSLEGGTDAWKRAGFDIVGSGNSTMSIERQVRIIAGALVLIGILLGSTLNSLFYGLSAFVGGGLIFAGITDWCGMGLLLMRMPWNHSKS